ncbi:MAG TPA: hypothetical protein VFK79_11060 [Xanthobacteraceae bacterium]|nr:hypothetical protein [Xanthobacteraceae bacterium]
MQTSIFLARLLGPALLIAGVGILLNQRYYRGMTNEFIASRPLFYLASIIGVIAGLAIVLVHNVWVLNWRVLITLLGWLNLIRGALSILLPEQSFAFAGRTVAGQYMPRIGGAFALLVGLALSYFGYVA